MFVSLQCVGEVSYQQQFMLYHSIFLCNLSFFHDICLTVYICNLTAVSSLLLVLSVSCSSITQCKGCHVDTLMFSSH